MPHRVFLVWEHPLLRKALQALLNNPEIEWVGDCTNLDELSSLLKIHHPEIVLVEEPENSSSHRAAQVLTICQQAHLRVIGINLSGNDIQRYEFDQATLHERDDLLNLILKE
jgi:DNA-binding NarL/FixJ family response regulator